ncbi:hypothetical protein ACFE04_006899 [Oxalis oulophora]
MYRQLAILSFTFVLILLISYSFFIGTIDLRPYFSPPPGEHICTSDRPLRVFMYNLPRRFNVGMMDRESPDDLAVTSQNLPPWPKKSGLRNQHSVEYWLMASLLYNDNATAGAVEKEMDVVRVMEPDSADIFFVPFFSSMSFNMHAHATTDSEKEADHQLQVDLLEFLRQSKYWLKSGGRDHVIPMTHPNAFKYLRDQVNASMLVVVDFGRYPKTTANLRKDVVSPYVHVVDSFMDDNGPDPFESRHTLLFFRGNTGGKIRAKLVPILEGYKDVIYEKSSATTETIKASTEGMRASKFCLNPAGDTPSSCRLFDAIVSHCVPVTVSDKIELPFEDEVDYTQFSLFFSTEEALQPGYLVEQLRNISKDKWTEMWKRLKEVDHHYEFQYPPKKHDAVNMIWRDVKHKLPEVELEVHRNQRLKIPDWW